MTFLSAYNEAPVGVLVSSEDNQEIVFANLFLVRHSKHAQHEVVGKKIDELLQNCNNSNPSFKYLVTCDDERLLVESKEVNYFDEPKNNHYRIHYVTVPEEVKSYDSNVYLNAILDNFPDSIFFKDKESRFLKVNKSFLDKYFHGDLEEIIGKTDADIFDKDHAEEALKDEEKILSTEVPIFNREEKEVNLLNEETTWVSTSKMPFYDENKNLIGTFGVSKDITHLKRTELLVVENLNILEGLTNSMPVLIFKFDQKGKKFEFMGKNEVEEAFRKSRVARLSIEDNLDYILKIASGNEEKQGYLTFTSSFSEGDEEIYFDNYIFRSVADADDYVGISIDVSERKINENNIKKHTKNLEKINKELTQFAYIISHDLKSPLRAISSLSEWIEEDLQDYENDEVKENLKLLRNRVVRLEGLINGILDYSRASREKEVEDNIDIGKVIGNVVDSLSISEHFTLKTPAVFPTVRFNKSNLTRVFINLISNAYKHHDKPQGTIIINYKDCDNFHEFSVEDDGPGIAEEYHDKIFVIFQTLKARDNFETTGIGLTIVKKIVEDCGGGIRIESELGKGSKFIFRIPKKIN